jgi:uncharacterized oligopeptide transporter (OPT) family protein
VVLRASLILRYELPFPTGRATAETLQEIFSRSREAALKLRVLLGSTAIAGVLKWLDTGAFRLQRIAGTCYIKKAVIKTAFNLL